MISLLLALLLFISSSDFIEASAESSFSAHGKRIWGPDDRQTKYLLWLPQIGDEILFNMQTRRMLEILHVSAASGRKLVEPFYYFGKRNWTWFEHGGNAVKDVKNQWNLGVEGVVMDPIGKYFNTSLIEKRVLPQGMISFEDFLAETGAEIDYLLQLTSQEDLPYPECFHQVKEKEERLKAEYEAKMSEFTNSNNNINNSSSSSLPPVLEHPFETPIFRSPSSSSSSFKLDAYGTIFSAPRWECGIPVGKTFQQMLFQPNARTVAIFGYKLYGAVGNDWRFQSRAHKLIRNAYKWREDTIMKKARDFIHEKFAKTDSAGEKTGEIEPFVAIHWRRGDWKNRVDASLAHAALWASSNPRPFVLFVKKKMALWGVKKIFLAHNCGKQDELDFVRNALPIETYPSTGHWTTSTEEAIVEQAIASLSSFYIGPPCVSPLHVSSFSRFVLDELEEKGMASDRIDFCCGDDYDSIEVLLYEPDPNEVLSSTSVKITGFSLIMPPDAFLQISLDNSQEQTFDCPLGEHMCTLGILASPGFHSVKIRMVLPGGVLHESVDERGFYVRL